MRILVNNWNDLDLNGCQMHDATTGNWVTQTALDLTFTFSDSNGNPLSGLTALSLPFVAGSNGEYLQSFAVGNLTPGNNYQLVLTSTGPDAGKINVTNLNVSFATRTT